jgi:predicted DNA-binding transcriptional regulator AlpA
VKYPLNHPFVFYLPFIQAFNCVDVWLKTSVFFVAAQEIHMVNKTCTCAGEKLNLLTAAEVAEMLRISYTTLLSWRSQGKPTPTAIELGGVLRYRETDVHQWLDKQKTGGGLDEQR